MQPSLEELEESFDTLLDHVLKSAKAHSEQQALLNEYLKAHPELFSVRFRTRYLKEDFEILIRELTRNCKVTKENVELLQDIVRGISSPDLDNLFDKHDLLIQRRRNPGYTTLDPAITQLLIQKMGYKWFQFSHHIGILDGTVDEIDESEKNNMEKMEKVLDWINRSVPHDKQVSTIFRGLRGAGRKDLEDEVRSLLKM